MAAHEQSPVSAWHQSVIEYSHASTGGSFQRAQGGFAVTLANQPGGEGQVTCSCLEPYNIRGVLELFLVRNQRLIESVQHLERLGGDHVPELTVQSPPFHECARPVNELGRHPIDMSSDFAETRVPGVSLTSCAQAGFEWNDARHTHLVCSVSCQTPTLDAMSRHQPFSDGH